MSAGGYAPGIKVREGKDLIQEFEQRDAIDDVAETAIPVIYSQHGGLFK